MSWRRDFTRPVRWTSDGRLVYDDYQEEDSILWHIGLTLARLINHESIDGFTNEQIAKHCEAYLLRKAENEHQI